MHPVTGKAMKTLPMMSRSTAESESAIEQALHRPGKGKKRCHISARPCSTWPRSRGRADDRLAGRERKAGVSQATIGRVRAAIEQLDYRHDVHASNLRRSDGRPRRSDSFSRTSPTRSCRPFIARSRTAARGMLVFAGSCDEDAGREREFISALRARRVDGIIVVPAGPDHSYLLPELRLGTAIVFVDRPPRFLDADSVTSDDHGAPSWPCRTSSSGPRAHRVPRCGSRDRNRGGASPWVHRRPGAHGLDFESAIVRTGLRSVEDAERCVAEIFADGTAPTALLSAQNYFDRGVQGSRTRDLWGRVAVVGFDDFRSRRCSTHP